MTNVTTNHNWFTEICEESGSAFSLQLTEAGCLHREQTEYQTIEIYETSYFGRLMVIDGFIMLSALDHFFYHEMMAHVALFTHTNPRNIAIIGGGDCGVLTEVLKHEYIEKAQQIDIDERVTHLSEYYFPQLCQSIDDPRAELHFADGIEWIKNAQPQSLDVLIIDSTDPIGPAEGLFKRDFYSHCLKALRPDGVLIQQGESPLIHRQFIGGMHEAMQQAGFHDTKVIPFPQPVYPTGFWSATMATTELEPAQFRYQDAAQKTFMTQYYQADIHRAALQTLPFIADYL